TFVFRGNRARLAFRVEDPGERVLGRADGKRARLLRRHVEPDRGDRGPLVVGVEHDVPDDDVIATAGGNGKQPVVPIEGLATNPAAGDDAAQVDELSLLASVGFDAE